MWATKASKRCSAAAGSVAAAATACRWTGSSQVGAWLPHRSSRASERTSVVCSLQRRSGRHLRAELSAAAASTSLRYPWKKKPRKLGAR